MNQVNQNYLIIKQNILLLAQKTGQTIPSQRNLLNKWFQDSIKTYILECIASPLIADYLKLETSSEVKAFIHKQTDNSKPKYMGIIEQYFIYINKCKKQDIFIEKLQKIIMNPEDITQQDQEYTYNKMKTIRKQFVCLLILKYFEMFGKQEMSSFYDLWNTCFPEPEDFQAKKKLSKFDKKNQNKIIKKKADLEFDQNSSLRSSQTYLNNSSYHSTNSESQTQQIITNLRTQIIDNSYQNQLQQQESLYISQSTDNSSQKKVINNRIFEEESYEEEPMNNYHQYNNYTNLYQQEVQHFNQFSCETSHYEQYQDQQGFFYLYQEQQCFQQQLYSENHTFENSYQENFLNNYQFINQFNEN